MERAKSIAAWSFLSVSLGLLVFVVFSVFANVAAPLPPAPAPMFVESTPSTTTPEPELPTLEPAPALPTEEMEAPEVYYRTCREARAAGAAPLLRGDPGYRKALDRDGDGKACDR